MRTDGKTYRIPILSVSMRSTDSDVPEDDLTKLDDPHVRRLIKQRFYQWALDQADGNARRINWRKVSKVVMNHTGAAIEQETLRKNFRPASKKQNKPPNQFRDKAVWQALYSFLVSDAVSYLHPKEVPTNPFFFSAFAGLQGFIDPEGNAMFPRELVGRFSNVWLEREDAVDAITVDFFGTDVPGPARVEVRQYGEDEFTEEESDGGMSFSGGAIHRSGGFVAAIVREAFSGQIKTLLLMQTRPKLEAESPAQDIVVLDFDGFSTESLERIETLDRDDTLEDPATSITHKFAGTATIVFLTRC